MFRFSTVIVLLFTLLASGHASLIKIDTGFSAADRQIDAAAYKSLVDAAVVTSTAGYGTAIVESYDKIANRTLFSGGSNRNIAIKSTIDFYVSAKNAGLWEFRAGVDFGHGGAIFVDGTAYDFKTNNMWWRGNYNNSSQYLSINSLNLTAGNHTLNIYGLEDCCDGHQQAQFRFGDGNFKTFSSSDNLTPLSARENLVSVPEPTLLNMFLIGSGLIWLMARRRKESIV
ncbi:MAG: CCXG family PEP-CTERM protein [Betaproteobacteria bacterium]|nr:CCXG family PEP-CTERM protein [Betaproteobacteria bacterium]